MPAVKTKRISTLIESQLPAFISSEYELFGKFVQKYYEAQEVQGGTLDVINNIQKYADIDFYEKNILKQNDTLTADVSIDDTTITVDDAQSFPKKNGYIKIDDEIIFYGTRTDTEFRECSRGVSGNTSLGDLYEASQFQSTEAGTHSSGAVVHNISNLFLYALVKNFETQYLGSFPEKYLKGEIDKRTLIKNIQKFYKSKGTNSSIKFVFNTIVAKDANNKPEVYKPKDYTYKSSNADWINVYALKCSVVSGDPKALIGQQIVQQATTEYGYASAVVDNVYSDGTKDGEPIWNIVLAPETVNGEFFISTKTELTKSLGGTDSTGDRVNVFSATGWGAEGSILIGTETITFKKRNATQFIIDNRQASTSIFYPKGTEVYKPVTISATGVSLLTLGVVYNLDSIDSKPYSNVGDKIQVSKPGFETSDPRIVKVGTNNTRWLLNQGATINAPTNPDIATDLRGVSTNVTSIHEDEQYYYITSSSYPSHKILDGTTNITEKLLDQDILRIIRKQATTTTERYNTPKADTGILLNGVRTFSYRDPESIRFGILEKIKVNTQGRGYAKPPFVLVDQVPNKARAVLAGQVVESIIVDTTDIYPITPEITITSGRRAEVRAIVTGGKVTSLQIDNAGEYYSSPPIVQIRDNAGRGRFASYNAIVDGDGRITDFEKIDEGNFYSQDTVIVDIIPVGEDATGIPELKEWNFNRFEKYKNELDTENGYIFQNYDPVLEYGYGYLGNPKALRVALNDNINNAGTEPATKTHSPIIGFAYDGNPIYGPFGYLDPLDATSAIRRQSSSYAIKGSRSNGPAISKYPLGTFVDDYEYTHKSGSLDENNGRFCVTPEFPQGTYAYFITIDSDQVPKFPYLLGANFYSLPVDSNYNSNISQLDLPKKAKRFFTTGMPRNGEGFVGQISDVSPGTVDNVAIESSSTNFSVNSKVYFDNEGTEGSEVEALVSSVKGKGVNYLQSKENKVVKLTTIQTAYLFADDILRQPSSGAFGEIVGTVASDNRIVLKNVNGTFDNTGTFSADIKTFSILVDQDSSYTEGAILNLTDGKSDPVATGEVLEGTNKQNVVKIKVLSGTWVIDDQYFIRSSDLFNTVGSRVVTLTSLSDNLEPFDVNQSVALIETDAPHGLGVGDNVDISINPDDATKTKIYFIRKRLYQTATLIAPVVNTQVKDSGVGRFQLLNSGADYTAGTYNNVPLTGGSGTGASANIVVSNSGIVSSVTIQAKGSGYSKADYLSVDDESLVRSGASQSTQRLVIYIDHSGMAAGETTLFVDSTIGYANNDLIMVGDEVMEITNVASGSLTVVRGKENTEDKDHYDNQLVKLFKAQYNFADNYQIFAGANSGRIQSYDRDTQTINITYPYSTTVLTANEVAQSSSFFDSSTPARLVSVNSAGSLIYKFEFSEDGSTFVPNPNIDIQEFYKYKFDTSHSSLTGTYFDLSPSKNFNLETLEKTTSTISPGSSGSFTEVKFGFGSRLATNNYSSKVGTNFTNFYYYDRKNIVNSEEAYLKIITDPLQGVKTVSYVTSNRFVYDISSTPLWDGSGSISYTTTGEFSIGEINGFSVTNLGLNYKKVPIVVGVDPTTDYRGAATVLYDIASKTITGVDITNKGLNYSNPKVVITNGDGTGATFDIIIRQGQIFSITVSNPGRGYTFAPEIEIVESDVSAYAESNTIGLPKSITISNNGGAYHLDKTVGSTFQSNSIFVVVNATGNFRKGEIIKQIIDGVEVARAKVVEWREGSNLLKVENITGIFRKNVSFKADVSPVTATLKSVFVTTFEEEITSFYDNLGFFKTDRGRLGVSNQKIIDSYFYQDYSYVVKSKTPINQWRELIKSTTHPAGFQLFGQVDVEGTADAEMPVEMPKASHFSVVQLWDPNKNKITIESTKQVLTQTVQKIENQRIRRGVGAAASSEFNFNELRAFEFRIYNQTANFYDNTTAAGKPWWSKNPFTGYYDSEGRLKGDTVFEIRDDLDNPFTPYNVNNLIITLDGVLQDAGVSYTVSGSQITFSAPPLGPGQKQTGEGQTDLTPYGGVNFYGKYIAFKDNQYNDKHFKKLRNIFQRNGRYIDAANQIERNIEFIIEETIGWGKATYGNLDWSTKTDDYQENIRTILKALDHDVRFGGNVKTVDYISTFNNDDDYLYIQNYRTESSNIFAYAVRLAKLATRNWDYTDVSASYLTGSRTVAISSTENVAVGMYLSSGRAFPVDTKIISIDNATQVTVSHAALANSGGGGGAPVGVTDLSGTATTSSVPTDTGRVPVGDTYELPSGVTVTVPSSFSGTDQITFSWSGLNNGMYFKAGELIGKNKTWIQETSINWAKSTYPSLNWEDPTSTRVQATATAQTLRTLDPGAVQINNAGDGFESVPTLYVFPASDTVVSPTNQIGIGVELSADLELNGYIKFIKITEEGSGYDPANPPTVRFGGDMSKLTGTLLLDLVNQDEVMSITVDGYNENDPTSARYSNKEVIIDPPPSGGTQATAEVILGKRVGNIWITEGGSGFTDGTPIGYIRGIGGTPVTDLDAQCNTTKRTTFTITNPGFGYAKNPTVTLSASGAGLFPPTATAEIDDDGRITYIYIDQEGSYGLTVSSVNITGFAPGGTYDIQTKCSRDIGYLVDAIAYHLQLGGNENVVQFAQFYYQGAKYPNGEKLEFVNNEITETLATFQYAKDQMIIAMRNGGQVTDPNVLVDSVTPVCAEVEATLNTYYEIVDDIFNKGKGAVAKTSINPNRSGYYTGTLTYSNYNIILDPNIPTQECEDVISGITSLYDNIDDIIKQETVVRTLPDFIDGETKEFDLFWNDGTNVLLEEDENLFLTLNAVLQKPKYTEEFPLFDAYFIDKDVIPNKIKFDVPPIWDQDFSAKTIGEPTAVEKVVGIGVGNYKRLTIEPTLVDDVRSGPFLILDVLDNSVQNIEAPENLYVFLDGVLQQQGDDKSYIISGPNIFFNVPIKKEMKIDMRYLYGRDVGSILSIYDYAPDTYFSRSQFVLGTVTTSVWDTYTAFAWMGDAVGTPIVAYQRRGDGTLNVLGQVTNLSFDATNKYWDLKGQNPKLEDGLGITFAVISKPDRTFTIPDNDFVTSAIQNFDTDDLGRKLLTDDNASWFGTIIGKGYRNPFVYLAQNDKVRLEGEKSFRKIKQLPEKTTSREGRDGKQTSHEMFGAVEIENYVGVTRGEGLSVIAKITNGVVTELVWNQRSYDPITQPTAYQYFTPPVLKFVPVNGDGGGARANVLVQKGQVISVDLLDGGSGYTKAPQVIVARRYDILTERDIGVSIANGGINPVLPPAGTNLNIISFISDQRLAGLTGITGIAVLLARSPQDTDRVLVNHVQPASEFVGENLEQKITETVGFLEPDVEEFESLGGKVTPEKEHLQVVNVLSTSVDTIKSSSVVQFVNKFVTTFENLIPNDALTNVAYYADGAFLQVDLDPTENVVYIADTSKFKPFGFLLIGDEVVYYYRKLNDRFLKVQRGRQGTTAQAWTAGTFLRQIPDPISVASVALAQIEAESKLVAVSAATGTVGSGQDRVRQEQYITPVVTLQSTSTVALGQVQLQSTSTITEVIVDAQKVHDIDPSNVTESTLSHNATQIDAQIQTVTSEFQTQSIDLTVTKAGSEFFFDLPPGGAVDGYEESAFFTDPISTRLNGFVDLVDYQGLYSVVRRDGTELEIVNEVFGAFAAFIGVYAKTNAGFTLSHRDGIFDAGTAGVSGLTISDFTFYFPSLTIRDFAERGSSSFALDGTKFILMPPSIQNPVAISQTAATPIPSTITVATTNYFPSEGYLFHNNGSLSGVIKYTGKTANTFTGCTLHNGDDQIASGSEIVPITID